MDQSRVPPYSEEAEKGVLGAVLMDAKRVLDVCVEKKITVDDFYIPAHRKIITVLGTMFAQDERLDILTIAEALRLKDQLESIGGAVYLDRLIDACPTPANADYYIDIIKQKSLCRQILNSGREAQAEAYNCEDPEELRSRMEMTFTNMEHRVKTKDLIGVYQEIDDDIQNALNGKPREIGISTGYRCIDGIFEGGLRNGGVYWLSGEESTGKTSLKCNIIDRLLITDPEMIIGDLTLEFSRRAEIEKLLGIHANTNISRIIRGVPGNRNVGEIPPAADMLVKSGRLMVEDQQNVLSTVEFVSWGRRMVGKYGAKLLTVDYFQKLNVPGGEKMTMEKETSIKSKTVIDLAGKLEVPILCVAATNDHGKIRGSRQADYDGEGHLRLKDVTEGEANGPEYVYDIEAFSQKARFGRKNVTVPLQLYGVTGRFEEMAKEDEQETMQV